MGESGFEGELRRGSQLLSTGQLGEAQRCAAEALAQRPANMLAQNLLGLILFQQRRFDRALEIFDSLVRRNPDVVTLRLNAGHAAIGAGNLTARSITSRAASSSIRGTGGSSATSR